MWSGTNTEPGQIAVSFYSGIFSYAGWSYLNFMTEELKDPYGGNIWQNRMRGRAGSSKRLGTF